MEMDGVVVYTAVFGQYDRLKEPLGLDGVRYVCFTDEPQDAPGWEYVVQEIEPGLTPVLAARRCKVLAHVVLPDADISVWHDGNLKLRGDPRKMAESFLAQRDVALFGHPTRDCAYKEAAACIAEGKGEPDRIWGQVEAFKKTGYPPGRGLFETGVIFRRHTKAVAEFNWEWWGEIVVGSSRDQISFPYTVWRVGLEPAIIPGAIHQSPAIEYRSSHGERRRR